MAKLTHNKSTYKSFRTKPLKLTFFASIIFACIYLGLWQIDRGNQKIIIYNSYQENFTKDPIIVRKFNQTFPEFKKLRVFGEFIPDKQFLLDNRVLGKKAGYEVITPYKVDDKIILVNRGWVENDFTQPIPNIRIKESNSYIDGYVFYHKKLLQLKDDNYRGEWPKIIQNIEINKISILLNSKLEPYTLIMSRDQDNVYASNRKFKKNTELKHFMYAGQWFLFAIISLIFACKLLRKDEKEESN